MSLRNGGRSSALWRAGRGRLTATLAAVLALAPLQASWAGVYTIQQGDTVQIAVAGLPELRNRSNVQPDGAISFPLLGALKVEGMTPSELRLEVQKQLAGKIYRMRNNDGREVLTVIEPEEVSAEIVGYRPIYVTGDVTHPGEQIFRPQMTVRQALALAGGPGRPRTNAGGYRREYLAVKSDYESARLEAAKNLVRIARLKAQLDGRPQLPAVDLSALALPKEQVELILTQEAQILTTTILDYQREGEFLKIGVSQTADRITVVEKQRTQEEEGSRADSVELQRMIDLLSRGQEINPRVTEARRALLLSSTRALQVNVELLELKRQKAEGERNLQRLLDGRRVTWLKELQDATEAQAAASIKVRALEAELLDSGRPQSGDTSGDAPKISIDVVRQAGMRISKSSAENDFELMPGDTIEVTLAAPSQTAEQSSPP